jgi:hypothetical protein
MSVSGQAYEKIVRMKLFAKGWGQMVPTLQKLFLSEIEMLEWGQKKVEGVK